MLTGLASGLLVFTGLWHATEWLMDGRRRDTLRLIPVGIVYAVLGYLLATGSGGLVTVVLAIVLPAVGAILAFLNRDQFDVRTWVVWAFILIDVIIVAALIAALVT